MEGNTSAVKIEPKNDMEYNLHQDAKLIMETELDMPIKSEEIFKEEVVDNQQLEYGTNSILISSIKEEVDVPIKSEVVLKEEVIDNQQLEYRHVAAFPSAEEELDRAMVHQREHWDNVKSRRKRGPGEKTREPTSTGGGPYKLHKSSYSEVEVVAPHINHHLGYKRDGEAVTRDDASTKRHRISVSDVTAALRSPRSTVAGTSSLECLNTTDFPTTSSAGQPLPFPTAASTTSPASPSSSQLPSPPSPHSLPLALPLQPPPLLSPSPTLPQQTTPPKLTRPGVLKRIGRAHEEREKVWLEQAKELHYERLAEARLNHEEAIRRHQRAEELHLLEVEHHRVRLAFEIEQMEARVRQAEAEARHQVDMHKLKLAFLVAKRQARTGELL
uniref:Uncharacterized protein n=1 Tax=Timema douglasi TaxID=61478 RepID=A0A7R8Z879_TIMDO|nr:unnamed protein product [Timema douglasi]